MKKIFLFLLILLTPSLLFAFEHSISSGEQTADYMITTGKAYITSVKVMTDGTNTATLVIYDAQSASGKVIDETVVAGADNYGGVKWAFPVVCNDGIYADISGTGASYIIEYMK